MKMWPLSLVRLGVFGSIILSLALACKKEVDKNVNWTGRVSNAITGEGVGGAQVTILASEVSDGTFNNSFQELASVKTNATGYYSFEYERSIFVDVRIQAFANKYFNYELKAPAENFITNQSAAHSFAMQPQAWVNVQFTNADTTTNESYNYQHRTIYRECASCCNDDVVSFDDNSSSFNLTCPVIADQHHVYKFDRIQNGTLHFLIDSVPTHRGDTANVQLYF